MTAHSILKKAVDLGVKLVAVDGRIKGRGAKPDPAFMAKLRAHEAEIVALLSAKSEPDIPASSATTERDVAPALASIPARYRHALERFKAQRPGSVTPFQFDQAVWAAEMFLVQWSSKAMEFCWTTGDLFEPARRHQRRRARVVAGHRNCDGFRAAACSH
jgi:hypothetical protein